MFHTDEVHFNYLPIATCRRGPQQKQRLLWDLLDELTDRLQGAGVIQIDLMMLSDSSMAVFVIVSEMTNPKLQQWLDMLRAPHRDTVSGQSSNEIDRVLPDRPS